MSTLSITIIILCLYVYYFLVLRRYNSLGLWTFSFFALIAASVAAMGYSKSQALQALANEGSVVSAKVISKYQEPETGPAAVNNSITVALPINGTMETVGIFNNITNNEWQLLQVGHPANFVVIDNTRQVLLQSSLYRSINGKWAFYGVALVLVLIGCASGVLLQQYMVRPPGAELETDDDWFVEPAFADQPVAGPAPIYTLRKQQPSLLSNLQSLSNSNT